MPSSTTVFDAQLDGVLSYRIPVLTVTANGVVLCAIEARNSSSDWGDIEIHVRRSTDGGQTFAPAVSLAHWPDEIERDAWQLRHAHAAQAGRTYNNPVFIAEKSGPVHFLFCVEYRRVFHRVSLDDGLTWSEPRDITCALEPLRPAYPWRVAATGPGHGIQLTNGRLVVPTWLARGSDEPGGDHRPSVVTSIYSDDGGQTWECGEIAAGEDAPLHNPSETVVAQLPDDRVVFNIRSENADHRRASVYSLDGATGWTTPAFDQDLFEPVCHASLLASGSKLYFANPQPVIDHIDWQNRVSLPRENVSLFCSDDSGLTWPHRQVIFPGPSGYTDLAELPNGSLLCLVEHPRGNDPSQNWTMVTLLNLHPDELFS